MAVGLLYISSMSGFLIFGGMPMVVSPSMSREAVSRFVSELRARVSFADFAAQDERVRKETAAFVRLLK